MVVGMTYIGMVGVNIRGGQQGRHDVSVTLL